MLHSLHYYACYYGLLCLLHQQQQAAFSLTIIIDGATTNEWATRDEYQRLIENSVATTAKDQQQQQHSQPGQQQQQDEQQANAASLDASAADLDGSTGGGTSSGSISIQLGDQLDLIEQLQREHQHKQQQLHHRHRNLNLQQPEPEASWQGAGARSISDLTPTGDSALQQEQQLAKFAGFADLGGSSKSGIGSSLMMQPDGDDEESAYPIGLSSAFSLSPTSRTQRLRERESAPKRYCGTELMEILDLVCQSRFYSGNGEPQLVDPSIKSKRFVSNNQEQTAGFTSGTQLNTNAASSRKRRNQANEANHHHHHMTQSIDVDQDGRPIDDTSKLMLRDSRDRRKDYNMNNINNAEQHQHTFNSNLNSQDISSRNNGRGRINRNNHSRMALYRRIRGAVKDCCERPCQMEELKPYCEL